LASAPPDYAALEIRTAYEELARLRCKLAELERRAPMPSSNPDPFALSSAPPEAYRIEECKQRISYMETMLRSIPSHLLRNPTVSYPLARTPDPSLEWIPMADPMDLELDEDGNIKLITGANVAKDALLRLLDGKAYEATRAKNEIVGIAVDPGMDASTEFFSNALHPQFGTSLVKELTKKRIAKLRAEILTRVPELSEAVVEQTAQMLAHTMDDLDRQRQDLFVGMFPTSDPGLHSIASSVHAKPIKDTKKTDGDSWPTPGWALQHLASRGLISRQTLMREMGVQPVDDGEPMTDEGTLMKAGFHTLQAMPRLYYRIEEDGGLMLTGPILQKGVVNHSLHDGSKVSGGFKQDARGDLVTFGERFVEKNGLTMKYPLRVEPMSTVLTLVAPANRRGRGVQRGPLPPRSNRKTGMTAEPKREAVLIDESSAKGGRWAQKYGDVRPWAKKGDTEGKSHEWTAQAYELLRREHDALQAKYEVSEKNRKKLEEKVKDTQAQIKQVQKSAHAELTSIKEEFKYKATVRRWQIEATPKDSIGVEGMEAEVCEMVDPAGNLRYLVVAQVPRGTSGRVQQQWLRDLQEVLDSRFGTGIVHYVIAPEDSTISVLEVLPGVDDPNDDDDLIQF